MRPTPPKFTLLLLFMLLYIMPAGAQQYECLKPGEKQYFINANGYLRGIRIDGLSPVGTDTIYQFFSTERGSSSIPNGSWVGTECIKRTDGTCLFLTATDTAFIETQAGVGEEWLFYTDTGARYFVAKVTSVDTGTVLGLPDSIKTISITAFLGATSLDADTLSRFEIKISKQYGFVQLFDFFTFPYRTSSPSYIGYSDYYLTIATSVPFTSMAIAGPVKRENSIFRRTAIHNPTAIELHDYQPGDVYGETYSDNLYPGYITTSTYYYDSVLTREDIDPWHVKYTIDRRVRENRYPYMAPSSSSYWQYTATSVVDTTTLLLYPEIMPEEAGTNHTVYYFRPDDSSRCVRSVFFGRDKPVTFEGCNFWAQYKAGIGQVSEATYSGPFAADIGCHGTAGRSRGAGIKNGIVCGVLHPPTAGVPAAWPVEQAYHIYPNPASGALSVSAAAPIGTITIYDVVGQKRMNADTPGKAVQLDISAFAPGLYIVFVNGLHAGKFVKN